MIARLREFNSEFCSVVLFSDFARLSLVSIDEKHKQLKEELDFKDYFSFSVIKQPEDGEGRAPLRLDVKQGLKDVVTKFV